MFQDVNWTAISVYAAPMLPLYLYYFGTRMRRARRDQQAHRAAVEAGLTEPASLHPLIDITRCIGCGACVAACPEQDHNQVLGLIDGKARLIHATDCIGHGACRVACPMNAITLVFGTERRGVDIPHVDAEFQTDVPGIYIAGELGGMGLIRNAIEQGKQAMGSIRKRERAKCDDVHDLVIVGAGPAGLAATLDAHKHGLRYVTLEQESLGGTVFQYPRGKLVMTAPVDLPLVGKLKFKETSKESLLTRWQQIEKETGIRINYRTRVESIEKNGEDFTVRTSGEVFRTRSILLAIGRRGTPRKLGVEGESLPKVVYSLIDPQQYRDQRVLVVGGGDSALEAALSIAAEPGTEVSISYRGDAFGRAKPKNRNLVQQAEESGRMKVILQSNVTRVLDDEVELDCSDSKFRIANDAVIVCAGGILPTQFLQDTGITVETKYGTA